MLTANATAIPLPVTTKTCKSCNIEKPFSEFSPKKNHKCSASRCKPCCNAARREYRHDRITPDALERYQLNAVRSGMIARCHNPQDKCFKHYGFRGITVCQRWRDSLDAFLSDMGPRPTGYQIDRIDNDSGYSPENCRWVTPAENTQNQRMRCDNKTGIAGVHPRTGGLYQGQIARNGIKRTKAFKQRWDAICWRKSMENRYRETGAL